MTTQQTQVTEELVAMMLDVALTHYPNARKVSRSYLLDQLEERDDSGPDETKEQAVQRIFDFLDSEYRYDFNAAGDLISPPLVKRSPAGYYIGRDYYDFELGSEMHYERESGYMTEEAANRAFASGVWWRS